MKNLNEKIRSKKLESRVDLTAMVSVSFLLIVFFMVTIDLAKPNEIQLDLPYHDESTCGKISCISEYRIITMLLDDNDKLVSYQGLLSYPIEKPKMLSYDSNGIRQELRNKKKSIQEFYGDSSRGPIVIIKPSKKCNYKNLIDILDEMAIAKIDTYAILNDFTPEESQLLAAN
ncbi:biopolymer transporter ExbD [Flavobacterium sp. SOK18b]|uniref:ExbD/TolR family protein n=1 Tax=Flavobacterium sp. SOK18b TaxID=797900 RepID=UPI0015FD5705|nr:biopolymer transporter ExbD [Flavobacterium sp. SOK18b]MBB1193179.1 biopolymer transporter ExbD [Flavobacterium sp. SOK18b]